MLLFKKDVNKEKAIEIIAKLTGCTVTGLLFIPGGGTFVNHELAGEKIGQAVVMDHRKMPNDLDFVVSFYDLDGRGEVGRLFVRN